MPASTRGGLSGDCFNSEARRDERGSAVLTGSPPAAPSRLPPTFAGSSQAASRKPIHTNTSRVGRAVFTQARFWEKVSGGMRNVIDRILL